MWRHIQLQGALKLLHISLAVGCNANTPTLPPCAAALQSKLMTQIKKPLALAGPDRSDDGAAIGFQCSSVCGVVACQSAAWVRL
jgi:hypothetical protein